MSNPKDVRWMGVAYLLESLDAGVDLEAVTTDAEWSGQALRKRGVEARKLIAVHDWLTTNRENGSTER